MFGKSNYMKSLESRKNEILAESEVNRIELRREWEHVKTEVLRLKKQVRAAGSIASSAAVLAATAALFRRKHEPASEPKADNHAKASWVSAAVNGAQVGASLFFKIRSLMRQRR